MVTVPTMVRAQVTVAMVADDRLGITFHTSMVRFQGTLYGSIFGYLAFTGTFVRGQSLGMWSVLK